MADISFAELEAYCKMFPIAYYAGKPLPLKSTMMRTSYANIATGDIRISYPQVKQMVEKSNKIDASIIRPIVYHEVSHVIMTPRTIESAIQSVAYSDLGSDFDSTINSVKDLYVSIKEIMNIFEDERIEQVCKNVYMETDFYKNICELTDWLGPVVPDNLIIAFFDMIRLHDFIGVDFKWHELYNRSRRIIYDYADLRAKSKLDRVTDYCKAVVKLFIDFIEAATKSEGFMKAITDKNKAMREAKEAMQNGEKDEGEGISQSSVTFVEQSDEDGLEDEETSDEDDSDEEDKEDESDEKTSDEDDSDEEDKNEEKPESMDINDKANRCKSDKGDEDDEDGFNAEEDDEDSESDLTDNRSKLNASEDKANDDDDVDIEDPMDDKGHSPSLNVEEIRKEFDASVFNEQDEAVKKMLNQKFFIKNMHGQQMGAIHKHSGKIDVKAVGRKDWKIFKQPSMFSDGSRLGKKMHLILVLDQSGSYSGNDFATNKILSSLRSAEETLKTFEFDVVKFGNNARICNKEDRYSESHEGTVFSTDLFNKINSLKKPDRANFIIFLNDGSAWCDYWTNTKSVKDALRASLDHVNCVCILDYDAYSTWFKGMKLAKMIVTNNYVNELSQNVCNALSAMLAV